MISIENEELAKALKRLNILIIPKNIAIFNDEGKISELYLSRFGISEIPNDFFDNPIFENIKKLYLNSNKLTKLTKEIFRPLKNLQYLNLSRNYLKIIDEDVFSFLEDLQELDLSNNNINVIAENSFNNLKRLRSITLKNNYLDILPENLFSSLTELEMVDLSINKFRFLPKALSSLYIKKLTLLDLKGNYIPYEFAKTFTTGPVIHSFLQELQQFWKIDSKLEIDDIELIIKQYLFDALMSVYHYSVNVPVLNYSLLGITLGYMTKNFHLLTSFVINKNDLSFRQTLSLWQLCLETFKPMEESLLKLLDSKEIDNERQRRILERKQKIISELEREVIEMGGIMDYKFKKTRVEELELEPVHENLFALIKQYLHWNTPKYSTIFL